MSYSNLKILTFFVINVVIIGSANAKLGFDQDRCELANREVSLAEVKSAYADLTHAKKVSIGRKKFAKIYYALQYARSGNLRALSGLNLNRSEIDEQIKIDDSATALAWAARCGRVGVLKYLISQGARVNIRFDYIYPAGIFHEHSTAAIWGVAGGDPEVIEILHQSGANFLLYENMYPVGHPNKIISFNAMNVPD